MNANVFLLYLFLPSLSPCRGSTCVLGSYVSVFSFSIIMFLIALVLDAQRLCKHWIEKLRTKHPLLVDETLFNSREGKTYEEEESDKKHLKKINRERAKKDALQSLEKIVKLVAKRTRLLDYLIYFPIIVIMLMLFPRIQYFDNLDFPLHYGIVSIASISFLLYAGLKLRSEANKLKLAAINSAKNKLAINKKEKLNNAIQEIQEVNYGAFLPMSEQPVVRSALLLVGSLGLFAAEYLTLFGY